jgi:hypothetical protein
MRFRMSRGDAWPCHAKPARLARGLELVETAPKERSMVRLDGIEPTTPAWKAEVLPLNYSRAAGIKLRGRNGVVKPRMQL